MLTVGGDTVAKGCAPKNVLKYGRLQLRAKYWIIALIVFLGIIIGQLFIPKRIVLSIAVVCVLLSGVAMLCIILIFKDERYDFCLPPLLAVFSAFFFISITWAFAYTFVGGIVAPFWLVSLPLGLVTAIVVTLKWVIGKAKIWAAVCFFLILVFIFFLVYDMYICHLNYVLDLNEPIEEVAVIKEKEYTYHSKSADTYEFKFIIDGEEMWLEVDVVEYETHEVGDRYSFKRYKGAFNKPFYISE